MIHIMVTKVFLQIVPFLLRCLHLVSAPPSATVVQYYLWTNAIKYFSTWALLGQCMVVYTGFSSKM